jgi:hypothetical protein
MGAAVRLPAAFYSSMASYDSATMQSTAIENNIPFAMERIVCYSSGGIYDQNSQIDE